MAHEDDGGRWSLRDRFLAVLIPLVLVVVATVQVVRVRDVDQSSWEGGGFGMFATYDNASNRVARVSGPEGEPLTVDDALAERSRVAPDARALEALGRDAARSAGLPPGTEVTVEVLRIRLSDADGGLRLEVEVLRRRSVGAPE